MTVHPLQLVGGMTISAIPDMAKVVFSHGLTSTFRDGFIPMVRNFRTFKLAAQEVKDAGTALDMILDSRAMAIYDITDDFGRHTAFERGLTALSSRFGVVSLMAPSGALLGPTLDAASDIFQATGALAAGDFKQSDLHTVRKLLPFQNLFWLRTLFDRVEAATGDALGLPDAAQSKSR